MQDSSLTSRVPSLQDDFSSRRNNALQKHNTLFIFGGGPAAVFTAYEVLNQAKNANKKIKVVVNADKMNCPCLAGNQLIDIMQGEHYPENKLRINNYNAIIRMMSKSLPDLVNLIAWEKIDCRLNLGFEMKSPDMEDLKKTINFMIQEGGYKPTEIKINTDDQVFNLPTHPRSVSIKGMGQVNLQELLLALVHRIKEMGGQVNEGVRYEGQHMNRDGSYTIHTNQGDYHTTRKPFLATGAQHQNTLPEFERANCKIIHTMGIVIGPLSPEDAARVSTEGKPMAFADTDLGGDILWGGLDEKRFLTIGRGDTEDSSEKNRERTHQDIMKQVENLYPGLSKYSRHVSFGPMLCAKNGLPVVGRMENYDVAGAWGNFGILPGFTAARAYANWLVKGNDAELKIFESMQPEVFFSPEPIADLTGTYSTRL